jgi:plastocyanin
MQEPAPKMHCHPERRLPRILGQAESKDLQFPLGNAPANRIPSMPNLLRWLHPRIAARLLAGFAFLFAVALAARQAPGNQFPPDTAAPSQPPQQRQQQQAPQQRQPVAPNPAATQNPAPAQPQRAPQNPPPAQVPPPVAPMPAPVQPPVTAPDLTTQPPNLASPPIAIVPLDMSVPGSASTVSGGMTAWKGRAYFTSSGAITAGQVTAQVTLPYRGVLRVCPSTTVRLSVDASAPAGEVPGLMIGMDGGAIEASFAISRNSDFLLTPNFRILIAGPGASEVKVRLGQNGDTCVDNSGGAGGKTAASGADSGADAPYVVVTSAFDSGLYRVQPGQRVMFEHGDLHTVVDQEKEPCGCPPPGQTGNEFPLAQSEGMIPNLNAQPPATQTNQPAGSGNATTTLTYNAPGNQTPEPAAIPQPPSSAPAAASTNAVPAQQPQNAQKKPGFFGRIGRFFKRIFGAE